MPNPKDFNGIAPAYFNALKLSHADPFAKWVAAANSTPLAKQWFSGRIELPGFMKLAMEHGLTRSLGTSQNSPPTKLTSGDSKVTIQLPVDPPIVGPDEDVELNTIHRFRLTPDDGQPVEFVGALIAMAAVERGETQRTWVGLYQTRGGKFITEIDRRDGRARNVAWKSGDAYSTVKVFETRDEALSSIRSTTLRNQLLKQLGLLSTRFID
jgi:hypothetical protein